MQHSIQQVAASHFLDRDKLVAFASTDAARKKYAIDDTNTVGTWHVDDLVNDFKKTQTSEALASDRKAEVLRQQQLYAQ